MSPRRDSRHRQRRKAKKTHRHPSDRPIQENRQETRGVIAPRFSKEEEKDLDPPGHFVVHDRSGKPHKVISKRDEGHFGHAFTKKITQNFESDYPESKIKQDEWKKDFEVRKKNGVKDRFRQKVQQNGFKHHPKRERTEKDSNSGGIELNKGALKAVVDKNRKGSGFLVFENRKIKDQFIPRFLNQSLFHGDRVKVEFSPNGNIKNVEILEHRFREIVGKIHWSGEDSRLRAWLVYERKSAREEVYIQSPDSSWEEGIWVLAKLNYPDTLQNNKAKRPSASIVKILGKELPPSVDLPMVAGEFNLIEQHSSEAIKEAEQFELKVPGPDLEGRLDLRELPLITIDGETARDFDDAVYVERKGSGYILWVAIADVSHYVLPGTSLDRDARSRGTSVYFPERAFHMLPRALSENLCSLVPNVPRLAMTAKIEIDRNGNKIKTEIFETVIQSHRRATYNEIEKENKENQNNKQWEFKAHFELYGILRNARSQRGSIDFDLPEAEIKVAPTGEVISIQQRDRLDSHRLIEEFMIAANEAVTEWALERKWPFVYRVHDVPSPETLEKFKRLASTQGIQIQIRSETTPKAIASLVVKFKGHPAEELLNIALLRSMKQAQYSAVHGSHFGLASDAYTHFTSPIRRYPDLIVHRMLRMALRVENKKLPPIKSKEFKAIEKDLTEASEHCSYRERIAAEAERESIRLKQVRLAHANLGKEMEGRVNGILESGFFVLCSDPYVEGFVSVDSLEDDYYIYIEDKMILQGRRTKKSIRIGQRIKVLLVRADLERRQVDFQWIRE